MLYREIIAVCSQIHTKHIYTLCGQNVELLSVKTGWSLIWEGPTSVTARSKASVCDSSLAGIAGSNPGKGGIDGCLL